MHHFVIEVTPNGPGVWEKMVDFFGDIWYKDQSNLSYVLEIWWVSAIKAAAQVMIICKPELFGTSSPDSPKSPVSAEDYDQCKIYHPTDFSSLNSWINLSNPKRNKSLYPKSNLPQNILLSPSPSLQPFTNAAPVTLGPRVPWRPRFPRRCVKPPRNGPRQRSRLRSWWLPQLPGQAWYHLRAMCVFSEQILMHITMQIIGIWSYKLVTAILCILHVVSMLRVGITNWCQNPLGWTILCSEK